MEKVGSVIPTDGVAPLAELQDDDACGLPEVDESSPLARRLGELNDAALVTRFLEAGLNQLTADPTTVESYQIDYCKVKPSRDINLALAVTLRNARTGAIERRHVSGTIRCTPAEAEAQFEEESAHFAGMDLTGRPDVGGFRRLVAFVPEMSAVLRVFPVDPVLSALVAVTDPARMATLLAGVLPDCRDGGWRPRDLQCDVVHYKPGRVCTFRYSVDLEHPGEPEVRTRACYGKTYRDERWQQHHELLQASWDASQAGGGAWKAARPLGVVPEWRFALQEAVPGRRFSHVFTDLTHDHASPAEIDQASTYLCAVARAVRSMQRAAVRVGPVLDFGVLLAAQERNLTYLRRSHPQLASDLADLRAEMVRVEPTIPGNPLGLSHGDFAHGNVLVDDHGAVSIIDFDRAGQAEPAYDVAYFLTHLCSYGIRHPRRAHVMGLCEAFRREYLRLAPEVSPRRLALYEALDLAAYVLRNFRKQSHQAKWLRWAPEQIRAAWERLTGVAA